MTDISSNVTSPCHDITGRLVIWLKTTITHSFTHWNWLD